MSYDLMFKKAIELQNSGALNQAEDIYLKMLQVMPENSDVWNLLGLIAQSKGHLPRAVDCFLSAIKYAPVPFFAHYFNLGLAYKSLGKNKEAKEALNHAVLLKSDLKEGFNALGILLAENGDKETGIKNFCRALEIDNQYDEARAYLCFYTNDYETLQNLATNDENNFYAQFLAARLPIDVNFREKYIKRAIEIAPERTDALLLAADIAKEQNNVDKALTFYLKVLNLDDKNLQAILGAADIYLTKNKLDKAKEYYLKSFDINRDIAGAHVNYGIALYKSKCLTEALEEYRIAAVLNPESPEISYNLALILKELGDFDEALGLMFNAHVKDPNNEVYVINIFETLSDLFKENPEKALKIAENWQKQEPDNIFSKHLLSSFSGSDDEKTNLKYVEKLFDNFALNYDETMAKLQPRIIENFQLRFPVIEGKVLDLGCATGFGAQKLKNKNNTFYGVDISAQMIEVAQKREIYQELYCSDIISFLENHSLKEYDWIIAFDVFCYFGDLKSVLEYFKRSRVCFSVEFGDEDRNQDYYLAPNGRYKHKKSYILDLLKRLHFKHYEVDDLVLRKEAGMDVSGGLFWLNCS